MVILNGVVPPWRVGFQPSAFNLYPGFVTLAFG